MKKQHSRDIYAVFASWHTHLYLEYGGHTMTTAEFLVKAADAEDAIRKVQAQISQDKNDLFGSEGVYEPREDGAGWRFSAEVESFDSPVMVRYWEA